MIRTTNTVKVKIAFSIEYSVLDDFFHPSHKAFGEASSTGKRVEKDRTSLFPSIP
jgi:hypothetical protein